MRWNSTTVNIMFQQGVFIQKNNVEKEIQDASRKWRQAGELILQTPSSPNFIGGKYSLLLGCGINVTNEAPTTSLATWVNILNEERDALGMPHLPAIEHEVLLAKYLNELDSLLKKFLVQGPSAILPDYYELWLHSNQIVKLTDHNSVRANIVGITEDYGLLIAKELAAGSDYQYTGNVYHLQPDGNTFDIFRGLISKKAQITISSVLFVYIYTNIYVFLLYHNLEGIFT